MIALWECDLDKTIQQYNYTLRASRYMDRILESEEFEDMDAEAIAENIFSGFTLVSFKDYLKRYIYLNAHLQEELNLSFEDVPDSTYKTIIVASFKIHRAPSSFTPSSVRLSTMVTRWLSQESVRRNAVFALGFGLNMTDLDVSEFLTKVLHEEDFDFDNPEELIYWYCYHFHLPYARAELFLKKYASLIPASDNKELVWDEIWKKSSFTSTSENDLFTYLQQIKGKAPLDFRKAASYQEFLRLYDRACAYIAEYDKHYYDEQERYTRDDITAADVEKLLCCGIPVSKNGNIQRKSSALLSKHFDVKRLSRQTIEQILSGKIRADRFDLISLQFLISALQYEDADPGDRLQAFMEEINAVLTHCRMRGLYSANAYECFILLSLLSEEPLSFYSDVLEYSYQPDLAKNF